MATVSRDAGGRYSVSFACEVEIKPLAPTTKAVGVDLGLTRILATSEGVKERAPRILHRFARQLARAQRVLSRRVKGSHRWHRARRRVARLQARIADTRRHCLHQLSTRLVRQHGVIALEDLNVKGLMRALRLSKSVADAALGELVRQIEYKARWYGREVIKIGRYDRSTGVCPECGTVGQRLTLNIRHWTCECGAKHDRDVAAAKVILQLATAERAGVARGAAYQPTVTV
jgi:putative transposase